MNARKDFAAVEAQLAAHLRDPVHAPPPPDVDPARVAVYARLVFNNVEGLLATSFPVLRSVLDEVAWRALVRDYLAHHRSHTPLFPRLPRDFVGYLADARADCGDPAWLAELAEYEWLEIECAQDPREIDSLAPDDAGADLVEDVPVLNPLARPRAYRHAVHTIAPSRLPAAPAAEPVWLVVFRDRTDKVGFLQLNAVSARLVALIARDEAVSGRTLLTRIADELAHPRPAKLIEAGRAVLSDMLARGLVVGARRRA